MSEPMRLWLCAHESECSCNEYWFEGYDEVVVVLAKDGERARYMAEQVTGLTGEWRVGEIEVPGYEIEVRPTKEACRA